MRSQYIHLDVSETIRWKKSLFWESTQQSDCNWEASENTTDNEVYNMDVKVFEGFHLRLMKQNEYGHNLGQWHSTIPILSSFLIS